MIIPQPFALPDPASLPPEIARYLPREVPPGVMSAGRRISRAPGTYSFALPLSLGDLLTQDEAIAAKQLLNTLNENSSDHMIVRIACIRHNRAFNEVLKGRILPPGENVRNATKIIDISPVFVILEPHDVGGAQRSGPALSLEKVDAGPPEVPLDTIQFNPTGVQVN